MKMIIDQGIDIIVGGKIRGNSKLKIRLILLKTADSMVNIDVFAV